jgi:hypothetical protein
MTDMKAAARSAMAAQLLSSVITAEHKPVKADLLAAMLDVGAERVRVTDDDGANLGAVSLVAGSPKARVVDERAFLAWVVDRYPGEVVQMVRESFSRMLLEGATAAGEPIDKSTGEVVPGVEIVAGEPYLTVRPEPTAKARMREMLLGTGLLQLPAGDAA